MDKQKISRLVVLHLLLATAIFFIGVWAFSYHLFAAGLPKSAVPVAPLLGAALAYAMLGFAGVAGMGFALFVDLASGKHSIEDLPAPRIVDMVAFSQYLTLAISLTAIHSLL